MNSLILSRLIRKYWPVNGGRLADAFSFKLSLQSIHLPIISSPSLTIIALLEHLNASKYGLIQGFGSQNPRCTLQNCHLGTASGQIKQPAGIIWSNWMLNESMERGSRIPWKVNPLSNGLYYISLVRRYLLQIDSKL